MTSAKLKKFSESNQKQDNKNLPPITLCTQKFCNFLLSREEARANNSDYGVVGDDILVPKPFASSLRENFVM